MRTVTGVRCRVLRRMTGYSGLYVREYGSSESFALPETFSTPTSSIETIRPDVLSRLANCLPRNAWTCDEVTNGQPLRSAAHWLFHLEADILNHDDRFERAGPDGVPVCFPGYRRMWAGGSIDFVEPIYLGSDVKKEVQVVDVQKKKSARSGEMIFVKRKSVLRDATDGRVRTIDTTNHVYVKSETRYSPRKVDKEERDDEVPIFDWSHTICADPVSLFRFSALTWNSHRIHYDVEHATKVEGYPDLVVHGPMLAILMLDSYQDHRLRAVGQNIDEECTAFCGYRFTYQGVQPAFVNRSLTIAGSRRPGSGGSNRSGCNESDPPVDARIRATNELGELCMRATVTRLVTSDRTGGR